MDKTRKYSKSANENGRRRLLGAQSTNAERAVMFFSLFLFAPSEYVSSLSVTLNELVKANH